MKYRFLLGIWIAFFVVMSAYGQIEEETPMGESFLYSFMTGEAEIQATYGNNAIEIERLNQKVWPAITPLMDGEYHILIVSHIYSETGAVSKTAINTASWRANTVRRYLKNKYGLDNRHISFYVDRSGEWGNNVHVYLLYYPMPEFANRQILFSTDQSLQAISATLKRYPKPPYIYVMNDPELCEDGEPFAYVVNNNKADLPYMPGAMRPVVSPKNPEEAEVVQVQERRVQKRTSVQTKPKEEVNIVVTTDPVVKRKVEAQPEPVVKYVQPEPQSEPEPQYQYTREVVSKPKSNRPVYQPFNLTVKTNLVPWATVSPGVAIGTNGAKVHTGSFMPNLELEYAFAGWGSIALGGTYSKFSYDGNPDNLWGVSALSLEPRLWFNDDGSYTGFNVGLRMQYGNFNVRDNEPLGHGETGQFFAVGAMLNVVQPIYRNFAFEAGVGFGTRVAFDAYTYERDYVEQISQKVEKFSVTHFMINFRLSLLYRFGFY